MKVLTAKNKNALALNDIIQRKSNNEFCRIENKWSYFDSQFILFYDSVGSFVVKGKVIEEFFYTNNTKEFIIYEDK